MTSSVVPSILDGRPVVVLEALSMGVPVVASRSGALTRNLSRTAGQDGCVSQVICRRSQNASGACGRRPRRLMGYATAGKRIRGGLPDVQGMLAAYEEGLNLLLPENWT